MQQQLTGWVTTVIVGNEINLDSSVSPVLNHTNSESDRKIVIGEKSLNITDKLPFKRKVFQSITSSPFVKLENGNYIRTARVKNSTGFAKLGMYATSNGKLFSYNITEQNTTWKTIRIEHIPVKGGRVETGFKAECEAKSFCYVDDVSVLKVQ